MSRRITLSKRLKDLEVRAGAALERLRCPACAKRGLTMVTVHDDADEEPTKLQSRPRCPQCGGPIQMLVIRVVPCAPVPSSPDDFDS